MPEKTNWTVADEISGKIIDIVNTQLDTMRSTDSIDPFQILAGQLVALRTFLLTMPSVKHSPMHVQVLLAAIEMTLSRLVAFYAAAAQRTTVS